MTRNAESVLVRADMTAFDFREAAWGALEHHDPQPDPASLSDRALHVVLRYREGDLPSEARAALQEECRRRGILPNGAERLVAIGLLTLLALSGLAIGWLLFAHP